ncbi:hypothetical protein HI914_00663 [Erysiphe necator]|nr:hypothetical protein HI914_00663 [Erysiphe necator]
MTDPGLARMRKRSTSLECFSACTKGPRSQSRASQPASRDALEAALNRVSYLYVAGGLHVAASPDWLRWRIRKSSQIEGRGERASSSGRHACIHSLCLVGGEDGEGEGEQEGGEQEGGEQEGGEQEGGGASDRRVQGPH